MEDGQVQENRYDAEGLRYEVRENENRIRFVYHQGELLYEKGGEENKTVTTWEAEQRQFGSQKKLTIIIRMNS